MHQVVKRNRTMPIVLATFGVGLLSIATIAYAQTVTQTRASQAALTPDRVLVELKAGNERFVSGEMHDRDLRAQVKQTASGQYPMAAIVGCLDSRVPPEMVFDMGIGDLFVGRIAGNYVDTDMLGSLEFATRVAGAKVILVLGHTDCGAVKGACDGVQLGNLTHTLANLAPALYAARDVAGPHNAKNKEFVSAVTRANVELNVKTLLSRSTVLQELVDDGNLKVVGGVYDLATGRVTFFD